MRSIRHGNSVGITSLCDLAECRISIATHLGIQPGKRRVVLIRQHVDDVLRFVLVQQDTRQAKPPDVLQLSVAAHRE